MKIKLQTIILAGVLLATAAVKAQYITVLEFKTPCAEINQAIKNGELEKVKKLIDAGADLKKTCHQMTLLQEAALAGKKPIVEYLLSKGLDPNEKAYPGSIPPPIYLAAGGGHKDIVELLLAKKVNTKSEKTPLIFFAVGSGDLPTVELLLNRGLKINDLDSMKRNVLHFLAVGDKRKDDDPKKPEQFKKMAQFLLGKGLKPNEIDGVGETPLQKCASLAVAGTVIPARDYEIYEMKKLAVAEALVAKGADVNSLAKSYSGKPKPYSSALEIAIQSSFDKIIDLLLKNKAKTDFSSGMNALHFAVYCGRWTDTINRILTSGVNINAKDKDGQTALFYMVRGGSLSDPQKKVFELLLSKKIDLNIAENKNGNTILHVAAKGYALDIVQQLVEHGADVNIKNKKGQTPLDLAKDKKINEYLVSKGAKPGK